MKSKVVLIVVLIVVGAILLSSTRKDAVAIESQFSPRKWVSAEEISLTANVIIGDLDDEAMEALPSDLTPNTDDLALTDEEKTELFAILNSVTESGVLGALGSTSPVGASAMKILLQKKAGIVRKIRSYRARQNALRKKIAGTKDRGHKQKMVKQLKKFSDIVRRYENALKAIVQKISQLNAKENATTKKADSKASPPPESSGSSARMKMLLRDAKALHAKYRALQKAEANWRKKLKVVDARLKKKNISPEGALKYKQTVEKRLQVTKKSMASVRKSIRMIEVKIKTEKRRVDKERKQNAAKALETKKALEEESAAKKLMKKSMAQAAAKRAAIEEAKSRDAARILKAKRESEKARKLAEAQRVHNAKVANAERARLELEKARAKKEADALAKKKAVIKREQEVVAEKARREKAALEARRRNDRQRRDAQLDRLKADEEKQRKKEEEAIKRAEKIRSAKLRKKAQETIRQRAAAERKQRKEAAEAMAALDRKKQKMLREKQERIESASKKKAQALLRRQQEVQKREETLAKKTRENATRTARMAADQKQRGADQKKRSRQALALKNKQLAFEREKERKKVEAEAALEKAKKDVATKTALVEERRLAKIKANEAFLRQKAERAEKSRNERMVEVEKGVQRITGVTINSLDLASLEKTVLLELEVFLKASGGHRLLPAITRIIKIKSNKEEAVAEIDSGDELEKETAVPTTAREKRMKMMKDFDENFSRITGGLTPNGPGSLTGLQFSVLEELLAYAKTLTGPLASATIFVENEIFMKRIISVFRETGTLYMPGMEPHRVPWNSMTIVDLDKVVEVLSSEPSRLSKPWVDAAKKARFSKTTELVAARKAAEEERARKQAKELEAIEQARALKAEEDVEKATAKLEQHSRTLETKIVELDQAVSAEKQRVAAEHQREVESIAREHEDEKQAAVEEIEKEMREKAEELVVESREQIQEVETEADSRLVNLRQQQAEEENQMQAESLVVVATIEAEISNTQDKAVVQALEGKLRQEETSRSAALDQTRKVHALQQQAVEEEARVLKEEIQKSTDSKLEEEKEAAREKLTSVVETIEQEKQELVEKQEKIKAAETEKIDLEGSIHTDILEQEKREVEENKEIVQDDLSQEKEEGEEEEEEEGELVAAHPRASKEDRVRVSRKKNPNGSSFIKLSVPSDMSPGEEDEITVFLKKDAVDLLAQYHLIHKKIRQDGSIDGLSADDKKVLASAGAEFKVIRDQYVKQRTEKVLQREAKLVAEV